MSVNSNKIAMLVGVVKQRIRHDEVGDNYGI